MEQTNQLNDYIKEYTDYLLRVQKAQSFAEVDDAKKNGLAAFQRVLLQLGRSQRELQTLARSKRTAISEEATRRARSTVIDVIKGAEPTPAPKPTTESKTVRKVKAATKKAKK